MHQMVVHDTVQGAALQQLALAPAAFTAFVIGAPCRLRALAAIFLPTARQLLVDCAGGTAKKPADAPLTIAPLMLGENLATFLAAEVLASSSIATC